MRLNCRTLEKQYKENLSDFREWEERENVKALVYSENFGSRMSIDETSLHNGEVYTILTNRAAKGKKGILAGIIKGTKSKEVVEALRQAPVSKRFAVEEVTLDLDKGMNRIVTESFPRSVTVADRFHTQKLVHEAVQEVRITDRRKAIDEENEKHLEARKNGVRYQPERYENGDTKKQLLARARYLLFKPMIRWTDSQQRRAIILFREFPHLKQAYDLSMEFRDIFERHQSEEQAGHQLSEWITKAKASDIAPLASCSNTISIEYWKILRYFRDRSTNAGAESFNAKLKGFRALLRGVRDIKFFLYRVQKLYA